MAVNVWEVLNVVMFAVHDSPQQALVGVLGKLICTGISHYRPLQQLAAGLLLWARREGDIDRLLHGSRRPAATAHSSIAVSSKGEQCHVSSRRRKLNTDLL